MSKKNTKTLDELFNEIYTGKISIRSFVGTIKQRPDLIEQVNQETSFLDIYDDIDFNERLYYIIHDLHEPVKCAYCNNKANFFNLRNGYRKTCKNNTCLSKMYTDIKTGATKISENRERKFKDWELTITSPSQLNDDVIKENIVADKYLQKLTNEIILDYLNNRLSDSESLWETWHRIVHNRTEPKPICARPGCNNPGSLCWS